MSFDKKGHACLRQHRFDYVSAKSKYLYAIRCYITYSLSFSTFRPFTLREKRCQFWFCRINHYHHRVFMKYTPFYCKITLNIKQSCAVLKCISILCTIRINMIILYIFLGTICIFASLKNKNKVERHILRKSTAIWI